MLLNFWHLENLELDRIGWTSVFLFLFFVE